MKPLSIGIEAAWKRITQFCAYQERCHHETRNKLYAFGLYPEQIEDLLGRLINENYLNEERFSISFARGKSRMKGWGTQKIEMELRRKQISDWCIKKAIQSLNMEEYFQKAKQVFDKKKKLLEKEKNMLLKTQKLKRFLLSKGYDWNTINKLLQLESS
jgi:regulatory protein